MSKKDRLKKQKERQIKAARKAEAQENIEKEKAKHTQSLAAKRLRKNARRGYANVFLILLTIVMTCAFLYSGFFYGGIDVAGVLNGTAELISKKTAALIGIGDVFMLAGIIIAFTRRYILQGVFGLVGFGLYMRGAYTIVSDIQQRLDKGYGDPTQVTGMDKEYMWRHYPIIVYGVISVILVVVGVIRVILDKKKEQRKRDTAPVESIVE